MEKVNLSVPISDTDSDDVGSFSGTELWQYKLWQYNGNMQP
jgi:hypothetical protein